MNMIQGMTMTSKASLKMQCLAIAKGDLKEAKELYEFMASDMELPDCDPVKPTWMDNTKDTVNGVMGWLKENQDTLSQGVDFIRGLIGKKTPEAPVTALPPINE